MTAWCNDRQSEFGPVGRMRNGRVIRWRHADARLACPQNVSHPQAHFYLDIFRCYLSPSLYTFPSLPNAKMSNTVSKDDITAVKWVVPQLAEIYRLPRSAPSGPWPLMWSAR